MNYVYVAIIAAVLVVAGIGYVWHERGKLDAGQTVASTEAQVEKVEANENSVQLLDGPALLGSLRRHGAY